METLGISAWNVVKPTLEFAWKNIQEAATLESDYREQVEKLRLQVHLTEALLKDKDRNRNVCERSSPALTEQLRNLQFAAMDAEDILEMCRVRSSCRSSETEGTVCSSVHSCISQVLQFLSDSWSKWRFMNETKCELESLCKMLEKREARVREAWNFQEHVSGFSSDSENWGDPARIGAHDPCSVDMAEKIKAVKHLLNSHGTVAVVGMGGIGKTHLLNAVFTDLKSDFEKTIWLTVSSSFSVQRLQSDILHQLDMQLLPGIADGIRAKSICLRLNGKRCLVVMDDIWSLQDHERGRYISIKEKLQRVGIPLDEECCRIMVSTRDDYIARDLDAGIFRMPLLSLQSGKELFLKSMNPYFNGDDEVIRGEEREKLVDEIVGRCGGLPLAIIVMSGMLRHANPEDWRRISVRLKTSENKALSSLRLSYLALSSPLKSCFAYMAVFPEDQEIEEERVVHSWKAEGFMDTEEESKDAFNQLLHRHLLQIESKEREYFYPGKTSIRMHDLVREVAVAAFKENGGITNVENIQSSENEFSKGIRRVSISLKKGRGADGMRVILNCPSHMRTLIFLSEAFEHDNPDISNFAVNVKYARVLWLRRCKFQASEIGKMKLLKFLDIKGIKWIEGVPEGVRELKCLEYLSIYGKGRVPTWMGELKHLSHFSSLEDMKWKERCSKEMPCLKVLRNVWLVIKVMESTSPTLPSTCKCRWNDIAVFTTLQEACVSLETNEGDEAIPNSVVGFSALKSLHIRSGGEEGRKRVAGKWMSGMTQLQHLRLERVEIEWWVHHLNTLQTLHISQARQYPIDICWLPNLKHLTLCGEDNAADCECLAVEYGKAGAFPSLQTLVICRLKKLKRLPTLEDGALPQLRDFTMFDCDKMEALPDIRNGAMPRLESLELRCCRKMNGVGEGWESKAATLDHISFIGCGENLTHLLERWRRK